MSRVVVVTGASAGVGRAIVREFAKEKAKLALIARGQDGLEAAQKEVESKGAKALVLNLDISDSTAVEQAAERIEHELGPIDVWINDAMVSVFSPVKEMKAEEYKRVTEVTYLGYVYGTLSALKHMLRRDRGIIIQIGSALAYRSIPLQSAYCGAKHAIAGFTESLRTELLHDRSNIQVCEVNLPAVNTPQFQWVKTRLPREPRPVAPIYQPEVIARAVRYISKHPRKKLEVGFSTIKAINAEKLTPALADRYLARMGYNAQQTHQPLQLRKDNLWSPVPGDHGARGTFSREARRSSFSLWVDMYRSPLLLAATALGAWALLKGFSSSLAIERFFEEIPDSAGSRPRDDSSRIIEQRPMASPI